MRRVGGWLRRQWGAVVVLLVSVTVAGFMLHVDYGDPFGATYETRVGTTISLSSATRVAVTDVRLAGRIQEGSSITAATAGVFLVVDYTIAVDDLPYGIVSAKLTAGGMTYSSIVSSIGIPAPGFQRSRHLVYEVTLSDLVGGKLRISTSRDLLEFERIVIVDLGLTPQRLDALAVERYQTLTVADGSDEVQR